MSKEQTIFYLKLLLCTSLIGIWIMCLTSLPEPKKENRDLKIANNEKTNVPSQVTKLKKKEVLKDNLAKKETKEKDSKSVAIKSVLKEKQEISKTNLAKKETKEKDSKSVAVQSLPKEKQEISKTNLAKKETKEKDPKSVAVQSLPKEKQEISKTNLAKKETKEKDLKLVVVKNQVKEKEKLLKADLAKKETKEKVLKPALVKSPAIDKSSISGQIHLANKLEVKKMLNDVKTLTNIIAPSNSKDPVKVEASPSPVQEVKPIVEVKPSPSINLALLNLPNVAGATRKVLESMGENPEIIATPSQGDNEFLRKEVELEKGTLRPVSDQINASKSKNKEWVPRYLQEEKKVLEKKVENLSNNLEQLANQIEVRGFVNGREGQKSVIIRNTLSDRVEILNKGDSYHGVLKLKEINDKGIVLENESLNKTFVKSLPN